ncbi:hypothetical protein PTSG_04035 [Salpingoeca rosetta]|uniref:Uncharacterized protein n=1 Tax=Salpingoeca rosetta (strain ATCC 50818 / BSB-021) TaxID=946362 RepID=F2U7L1_SALR5|nr:uncharacterized protein PTSG_04035 [Salpingoeca rosetta]EGD83428.1 hypothetical protein PTSG_04035 [Salpingoeca rosetta]|eukprot:XP_004994932.1 hypothetical protein PTSG_04035 [Salpingoeca rosetta]
MMRRGGRGGGHRRSHQKHRHHEREQAPQHPEAKKPKPDSGFLPHPQHQHHQHHQHHHQQHPENQHNPHLDLDVLSNPHTLDVQQLRALLTSRGIDVAETATRDDLLQAFVQFVAPKPQREPRSSRRRQQREEQRHQKQLQLAARVKRMAAKRRTPAQPQDVLDSEGRELKRTKETDHHVRTMDKHAGHGAELVTDEHGEQVVKKPNGFQFKVITWP